MSLRNSLYLIVTAAYLTQAGPAVPRKRTILGPEASQAQLFLQEDFLKIQTQVLQISIQLSNVVQMVTKQAFQMADEAKSVIGLMTRMVLKEAESMENSRDLSSRKCIKTLRIRDGLFLNMNRIQQQLFSCTHTLSEKAMQLEKKMTSLINLVRAHIIQAMDAMWLCEPESIEAGDQWTTVIDEECLIAMKKEGEEIIYNLPEKAEYLLEDGRKVLATSESSLKTCNMKHISEISERATFFLQQIRNCNFTVNPAFEY